MADPTIGFTFSDYILRVAEYLGIAYYGSAGDQVAQIPVDVHDLDLCKRIVNDGYSRFLTESPTWRFLTVPVTIQFATRYTGAVTSVSSAGAAAVFIDSSLAGTYANNFFLGYGITLTHATASAPGEDTYLVTGYVGATGQFTATRQSVGGGVSSLANVVIGDTYELADATTVSGQNYRYYMPDDFGGTLAMPWTYAVGGPRIAINPVDEHRIRELRVGANTSGTPSVVAITSVNTDDTSNGKRWEAQFWPRPTGLNRVTAVYRRYPAALTNLTDRSVAGFQHDHTIRAAVDAAAELQRNDTVGTREQMYQAALARSRKIDARASADKVSDFGDRSEDRAVGGRRPLNYYSVDTYNGSDLNS